MTAEWDREKNKLDQGQAKKENQKTVGLEDQTLAHHKKFNQRTAAGAKTTQQNVLVGQLMIFVFSDCDLYLSPLKFLSSNLDVEE